MRRRLLPLLVTGLLLAVAVVAHAQTPSSEEQLAEFDKGSQTLDVSSYPEEMQQKYQLFAERCSKCHTLARPINSDYALEEEWSRYVKRMMRKPGSGIAPKEAKQIFEFLAYDSSIRKKDLIEKKKAEQGDG
ncbi:MAG: photosystem P840 reaction-center cytochrome c-551 [Acidimicrobiia bacterium]|nr:photosystem P840 reaction-center cytochrome c-551 [Acidimicrobiia bacterium]